MADASHSGQCPGAPLLLRVYSSREEKSEANVNSLLFTFLSLCKHLSTGYLPGTAGSLDLEMLALAGTAACQELRHFDAA